MGLKEEIADKRKSIHTDSYPMSIGELLNLYRDGEIDIHPEFQRFFRWSDEQKSRLVDSLLLGIPLPSIFVQQRTDGVWDVIDGLQRLSTIFQLTGDLKDELNSNVPRLVLKGTKYLPSLENCTWDDTYATPNCLDRDQQLIIKRSKIDMQIILRESDESSKYELFQRLNSGGSPLSSQELRNCVLIMINRSFYARLKALAQLPIFTNCVALTDRALDEQYDLELIVRFLVFRKIPIDNLKGIGDLGEFLTDQILTLAKDSDYDIDHECRAFEFAFNLLAATLGEDSFRRYEEKKGRFSGAFLISAFEVMAIGLGSNYENWSGKSTPDIINKAKELWSTSEFLGAIGSGIRGSTRIPYTIPFGREYFKV